jgi:hypothetical protein
VKDLAEKESQDAAAHPVGSVAPTVLVR